MFNMANVAHAEFIPVSDLPAPKFVAEKGVVLQSLGCELVSITPNEHYVSIPDAKPHHVIPSDWDQSGVFFCDSTQLANLSVASKTNSNVASGNTSVFGNDANAYTLGDFKQWVLGKVAGFAKGATNTGLGQILPFIEMILGIFNALAQFIIIQAIDLLGPVLGFNKFITNPMVNVGWPFIQGIANLGFIIALLFIAFATTLRFETVGIRRMLPRLLLAAVLINFSLVIGGVLIDMSRILMAIMLNMMAPEGAQINVNTIGAIPLNGFDLITSIEQLSTIDRRSMLSRFGDFIPGVAIVKSFFTNNFEIVATMLLKTFLFWIAAGSLLIIVAQLFVRYIVLVLLLMIAPLAYLAIAFPLAENLAKRWWTMFLKYVFYGPVVIFILLIMSRVIEANKQFPANLSEFHKGLLNLAVTASLLVIAAQAGKQAGLIGAAATVGFVTKQGKRLAGGTYRYGGGALATRALKDTAKIGLGAAGGRMSRSGNRFIGTAGRTLQGVASPKGGKSFMETISGKKSLPGLDPKARQARRAINFSPENYVMSRGQTINRPNMESAVQTFSGWSPASLAKKDNGAALSRTNRNHILEYGNQQQRVAMLSNKEAVKNMDDTEVNRILNLDVTVTTSTTAPQAQRNAELVKALQGSLKGIADEKTDEKK